jgi:hypothetical protein
LISTYIYTVKFVGIKLIQNKLIARDFLEVD